MPQDKNELDKFLEGVAQDAPRLEEPVQLKPEEPEEPAKDEPRMNRAQRRSVENAGIRAQLQEEREARIAAEARAAAIAELKVAGDVDENLYQALFGSAPKTPETTAVTGNLKKVLEQNLKEAEERAFQRLSREQQQEQKEERQFRDEIDGHLSSIEDEHDVDLTSNTPSARKLRGQLLDLVEKLSPKDGEGTITQFADFGSAFELLQQNAKVNTNTRAKDLADRSLQKSGQADIPKEQEDATRAWLRRNGIRV